MRLYIDSNVIISLFKEEIGHNLRALYIEADNFFARAAASKEVIVISQLCIYEIEKICLQKEDTILQRLEELGLLLEIVDDVTDNLKELHKQGVHFPDSAHAKTAITTHCDFLVTFNLKDFLSIQHKIKIIEPKEY